jgi:ACS family hexuronate transporter-like MFS transporter
MESQLNSAQRYGFRAAFLVPASLGLLWSPLWIVLFRDLRGPNAACSALTLLPSLLRQSSARAVMLCRFFIGPVMRFYWYWIPSYLFEARHLTLRRVGFLGWLPFFLGDAGV